MAAHDRPTNVPANIDLVEGSYIGTSDDVAGTWYAVDREDDIIDKRGRGWATRREAWAALRDQYGRACPACGSRDLLRGLRDCGRCGWHDAARRPDEA